MQTERPNDGNHRSKNNFRLYGLIAVVLTLVFLLFAQPFDAFSDNTLFSPIAESPALATDSGARRARAVRVNWNALRPEADEISLNLFDDVRLTALRRRVDASVTGGFVWVGGIAGDPAGDVALSVQDGVLSGSVYRFGREWAAIRYAGTGSGDLYYVLEIDLSAPQPETQDYLIAAPSQSGMQARSPEEATCVEDGSIIDVMVVYTPAARDAAGGQAAIEALINQRVTEMNSANDNSIVAFEWRLAHALQVDYNESGDIKVDLELLQNPVDGVLDGIHAARDAYHADLVAMLISEGTNGVCGYAFLMHALDPSLQGIAFGVTALDYADPYSCSSLTLAHELGHNMGSAHDRAHAGAGGLFPYAFGYQSPNQTFRDIMSYDCPNGCPRINQWANPDVTYMGEPTGVDFEANPANAADVARTMNEARTTIANFRVNCVEPTAVPTPTPGGGVPSATPQPTAEPTSGKGTKWLYMPAVIRK
jgi:hypothetical protein